MKKAEDKITANILDYFLNRPKLYQRKYVLSKNSSCPRSNGIYAWYFKNNSFEFPNQKNISKHKNYSILYIGIAPSRLTSKSNIRKRIFNHFQGTAYGSTLRLSLGVLLSNKSKFILRRIKNKKMIRFTDEGEDWIDNWLEKNSLVSWFENQHPWKIEKSLINKLYLPFNIQGNLNNPFKPTLIDLRKNARERAMSLSIIKY